MHSLSNRTKSDSNSEPQNDAWSIKSNVGTNFVKEQIKQANTVPIILLLNAYGIKVSPQTKHICCPFSSLHNKGKDRTPSFTIYTHTNSFWCFGCKTGSSCVDFVINLKGLKPLAAAQEIIAIANGAHIDPFEFSSLDFSEKMETLMNFATRIRQTMNEQSNQKDINFLEEVCSVLDTLNTKYKKTMTNETLLAIVDKLIRKVENRF